MSLSYLCVIFAVSKPNVEKYMIKMTADFTVLSFLIPSVLLKKKNNNEQRFESYAELFKVKYYTCVEMKVGKSFLKSKVIKSTEMLKKDR